jgi:hypothetical protein
MTQHFEKLAKLENASQHFELWQNNNHKDK